MQTRQKTREATDYLKFEKTCNYLLSQLTHAFPTTPFKLRVDTQIQKQTLFDKISIKTRADGTLSKPDAELVCQQLGLLVVCDAKHYTSELGKSTIQKTLDDMRLRETEYGILICSEDTKMCEFQPEGAIY